MKKLLQAAVEMGASDLHLTVGTPPFVRVHGEIVLMPAEPLTPETSRGLIYSVMNPEQIKELEREWALCYSFTDRDLGYFRVAVYYQQGCVEAAIRIGPLHVRPLAELGLPPALEELIRKPNGLILITGPTGAGKTTTLNALIDSINRERRQKIVLVEDPIEYLHDNIRSIIVQQEVHTDTKSFGRALVHILRQDPNVIGIGEMRDAETISSALTAAETGHLVIATLHASDCVQTVNRIVDVFPEEAQAQVRSQLAMSLRGVINQRLLPRADQPGRVVVYEMLVVTHAVANLIRENKLAQVYNVMATGRREGMAVMDDMVRDLYQKAVISYDTAVANVSDPKILTGKGGRA